MIKCILFKYLRFIKFKKKIWAGKQKTNLFKLLDTPALATRVLKFFFTTKKLLQFRHLNESKTNNTDNVDLDRGY